MSTVIKVNNLSKRYRLGLKESRKDTLFAQIGHTLTAPVRNFKRLRSMTNFGQDDDSVFWALKDINFEVQQGEVLGIIGHNGAGKSTLLKLLSRITEPTTGSIALKGRVAALLEVGTGFHQDLTGRENIYMNGTILGMTKKEIDRKLDEIVDFSGVEKHLDTPVKFYSSGMKVRLGFSVAAHLEPEILIIDEVLAVGDAEFQKKCLGKMENVAEGGRTILFVSHDMGVVSTLCPKSMLLKNGKIEGLSNTKDIIKSYHIKIQSQNSTKQRLLTNRKSKYRQSLFHVKDISFSDSEHQRIDFLTCGEEVNIIIEIKSSQNHINIRDLHVDISIYDPSGNFVTNLNNKVAQREFTSWTEREKIACNIKKLPLMPGQYSARVLLIVNSEITDWIDQAFDFEVMDGDYFKSGYSGTEGRQGVIIEQNWYKK